VRINTTFGSPPASSAIEQLLSPQQLLVLQLLARGYSREQIAEVLGVAEREVSHCGLRAAGALGVSTVGEAVVSAQRRSLID
jgi:DNA-binding NarL/FixJ family response regulator